jgi:hypothetical protein
VNFPSRIMIYTKLCIFQTPMCFLLSLPKWNFEIVNIVNYEDSVSELPTAIYGIYETMHFSNSYVFFCLVFQSGIFRL